MRFRNICFTSFNEVAPVFDEESMAYMIYQQEKAPTTGKLHWQGYVEFKEQTTTKNAKRFLGDSTHLEARKGSQEQAINYCKKSDTAVPDTMKEQGKKNRPGGRSDLDSMTECILSGCTTLEILREFRGNALRHISHIERGLQAAWGRSNIDNYIYLYRETAKGFGIELEDIVPSQVGLNPFRQLNGNDPNKPTDKNPKVQELSDTPTPGQGNTTNATLA